MSSRTESDLMYAVLAMDAYNRGDGAPIKGLDETGANAKLGNYSIVPGIPQTGWQSSGFYAVAYQSTLDAKTIVSYRGTDQIGGLDGDLLNGWKLGAGLPSASQGKLALDFYKAVNNGVSAFIDSSPSIVLTGHSLGGGLAGFVGTIASSVAVGFDHMPFLAATYAAFINEFRLQAVQRGYAEDVLPTDDLIARFGMHRPSFEQYGGIALEGEVNHLLRDGTIATAIGLILGQIPYAGPFLAALGGSIAGGQIAGEQLLGGRNVTISTYDWSQEYDSLSQDRHSISSLVIAKFAADMELESPQFSFWRAMGLSDLVYSSLYNKDIGLAADALRFSNEDIENPDAAGIMRTAIAYSAIETGERPFGDTGIRAMFDDANNLGYALSVGSASHLSTYAPEFTKTFVQFAGELALNGVVEKEGSARVLASAPKGILSLSTDTHTLSIDFRIQTWIPASGEKMPEIPGQAKLLAAIRNDFSEFATNPQYLFRPWGDLKFVEAFDRVTLGLSVLGNTVKLADSESTVNAALYVGTDGQDFVTGSSGRDLIIGNGGDDILSGGGGNDILVGGAGNDQLSGNAGFDTFLISTEDNGKTTILDDGGSVVIDWVKLGSEFGTAKEGSIVSGVALQDESADQWYLGGFTITRSNGFLTLDGAARDIKLEYHRQGDYGLYLGTQLDREDVDIDAVLLENPNYLNYYLVKVDDDTTKRVEAYAYSPPKDGVFETHLTRGGLSIVKAQDIIGTNGNDKLDARYAFTSSVNIKTGLGSDIISSNADFDMAQFVDAGEDRDFITAYGGKGSVNGGAGDDEISFTGEFAANALTDAFGGSGRDLFSGYNVRSLDGGEGIDTWNLNFALTSQPVNFNASVGSFKVPGSSFEIKFSGIENFNISSGSGNSQITTGSGTDDISTYGGHAVVRAGGGNDRLAPNGYDQVFGEAGDDFISADQGYSTMDGGDGNDTIYTTIGGLIDSGTGNDIIKSFLSRGITIANGGRGNDEIELNSEAGSEAYGDGGNDKITLKSPGGVSAYGGDGDDFIVSKGIGDKLYGEGQNDHIQADGESSLIYGGAGDDVLISGGAEVSLYGGAGSDSLISSGLDDFLAGGQGDDRLSVGNASGLATRTTFSMQDGDGTDRITNNDGAWLKSNEQLYSLVMNGKTLTGHAVAISPSGTPVAPGVASDYWKLIVDGEDFYLSRFNDGQHGNGVQFAALSIRAKPFSASLDTFDNPRFTISNFFSADRDSFAYSFGLSLDFVAPLNPVIGSPDADNLQGTSQRDSLMGFDGDDTLTGGKGDDALDGGTGVDTAVFNGRRSEFQISGSFSDGLTIKDLRTFNAALDGTDTLKNIEILKFSDQIVTATHDNNHAPQLVGEVTVLPKVVAGGALTFTAADLLKGFSDADGDDLSVANIRVYNGNLSAPSDGTYSVTPTFGFIGQVTILYHVVDAFGGILEADLRFSSIGGNAPVTTNGTSGADVLKGTLGADVINALGGNDYIEASGGKDVIDGGVGYDALRFYASMGLAPSATGYRTYTLTSDTFKDSSGSIDTSFTNIERFEFSTVNATSFGDVVDASAFTGSGGVYFDVLGRDDVLIGSNHADSISVRGGRTDITGGGGTDLLQIGMMSSAAETITSSVLNGDLVFTSTNGDIETVRGVETISFFASRESTKYVDGSASTVSLEFQGGYASVSTDDRFVGGSANDRLFFGIGRDTLTGGAGADTFMTRSFTKYVGQIAMDGDTIIDFATEDFISFADVRYNSPIAPTFISNAAFTGRSNELRYEISGGQTYVLADVDGDKVADATLTISNGSFSLKETFAGSNILQIDTTSTVSVIRSTSGKDDLAGTDSADLIRGLAGDDTISGGKGNDFLEGGSGNDTMRGGAGADIFFFASNENTGRDKIMDFDEEDVLISSQKIFDSNSDGVIEFGSNRELDFLNGGRTSLYFNGGARGRELEYDGFFEDDGSRYYVYSKLGSGAVDFSQVHDEFAGFNI